MVHFWAIIYLFEIIHFLIFIPKHLDTCNCIFDCLCCPEFYFNNYIYIFFFSDAGCKEITLSKACIDISSEASKFPHQKARSWVACAIIVLLSHRSNFIMGMKLYESFSDNSIFYFERIMVIK